MVKANKKRAEGSLDGLEVRGYYSRVIMRFLAGISLVLIICGCQSNQTGKVLTPSKFEAVFAAEAAGTNGTTEATAKPKVVVPGMQISVTVDEDRSLNRQYTVPNSGAIDYPPLGRVAVEGLTTDEVAQRIKEALEKDYFHTATVHVAVESASGAGVIYVIGSVNRPGPLLIPKDERFTVTKAIIAAGNFSLFGNGGKVQLIRYDAEGKKYITVINVDRIMKQGEFEKDIAVQSGDWIIVPEKLINF